VLKCVWNHHLIVYPDVKREENKIIAELKKGAKQNMPKGALRALGT